MKYSIFIVALSILISGCTSFPKYDSISPSTAFASKDQYIGKSANVKGHVMCHSDQCKLSDRKNYAAGQNGSRLDVDIASLPERDRTEIINNCQSKACPIVVTGSFYNDASFGIGLRAASVSEGKLFDRFSLRE